MHSWLHLRLDGVNQRFLCGEYWVERLLDNSVFNWDRFHDAFLSFYFLGLGRNSSHCWRSYTLLPSQECHSNNFLDGTTKRIPVELSWYSFFDCAILWHKRLLLFRSRRVYNYFFFWVPGNEVLQNGICDNICGGGRVDLIDFFAHALHHWLSVRLRLCSLCPSYWWKAFVLARCETAGVAQTKPVFAPLRPMSQVWLGQRSGGPSGWVRWIIFAEKPANCCSFRKECYQFPKSSHRHPTRSIIRQRSLCSSTQARARFNCTFDQRARWQLCQQGFFSSQIQSVSQPLTEKDSNEEFIG